jgi:hypothetical protein
MEMEEHQNPNTPVKLACSGYSPDEIGYHVKILEQAGFIQAKETTGLRTGIQWLPLSLTWKGHEFLDATRNEGVWQKLKAELKDRGMSLPFSLIQDLAIKIAAEYMGLK